MRIIKRGKIPPLKEKYKYCFNCDTEMTYTKNDIKYDYMTFGKYIICPICKEYLSPSIFDRKVKK